jgi:hypothetical protein
LTAEELFKPAPEGEFFSALFFRLAPAGEFLCPAPAATAALLAADVLVSGVTEMGVLASARFLLDDDEDEVARLWLRASMTFLAIIDDFLMPRAAACVCVFVFL